MMRNTGDGATRIAQGLREAIERTKATVQAANGDDGLISAIKSPLSEREAAEVAAEALRDTQGLPAEAQAAEVVTRLRHARVVKDFPPESE